MTNFELATRVPLMVSLPGQPATNNTVDTPVELIDVFPTLAEVNSLCVLPTAQPPQFPLCT